MKQGFDFLGQNVRKYKGRLIIKPSKASVKSVKEKLKETLQRYRPLPEVMVGRMNSIIHGWCFYHRHVASKRTFSALDAYVYKLLWRWARRQHPKKSRKWIIKKCFHTIGNSKWNFGVHNKRGSATIFKAATVPIRRHVLIRGDANPINPDWKAYFERRANRKLRKTHPGSYNVVWKRQQGHCAWCHAEIEKPMLAILHFPHDNIALDKDTPPTSGILLHATCHHSQAGSSQKGLTAA